MAKITLKGTPANTNGELPAKGSHAPKFTLVKKDMTEVSLDELRGKKVVLNIFPSVDTGVCAQSIRTFNKRISDLPNAVVLCISKDLPFAAKRFCGAEGIENAIPASAYRSPSFSTDYGVEILDGAFKGLTARSVIVLDEQGVVKYTQLVPEIGEEPDYESALRAL